MKPQRRLRAYAASPLGFTEDGRLFMDQVWIPELDTVAHVVNPWALTTGEEVAQAHKEGRAAEFNMEIGRRNHEAIDNSDIVIAILNGTQVDDGTAAEIGYAFGKGKTVFGYRNDLRKAGEGDGVVVNLQVQYFIVESGGSRYP